MRRLLSSFAGLAIALSPAAGLAATDTNTADQQGNSGQAMSLDLLSLTEFTLNPSQDTWISLIQQIRAHPCYNAVGREKSWCEDRYGLTDDLHVLLNRSNFADWLHGQMVNAACSGLAATEWIPCVNRVPVLTAENISSFNGSLGGTVAPAGQGGPNLTTSNSALFELAGTAPTTRQNALRIIAENENDERATTPYERSTMLWEWCADSHMGQSGCFHSFQRFVNDPSITQETIRDVIERNGR